jgi:hypothetical protein
MIWPWSELRLLRDRIGYLEDQNRYLAHNDVMRKLLVSHAYRDLIAANKGIRRLVEKLKKKGTT